MLNWLVTTISHPDLSLPLELSRNACWAVWERQVVGWLDLHISTYGTDLCTLHRKCCLQTPPETLFTDLTGNALYTSLRIRSLF